MKTLDPQAKSAFTAKGYKLSPELEDKLANIKGIDWVTLLANIGAMALQMLLAAFGIAPATKTSQKASCPSPVPDDGCQCCCCAAHHFALAAACCACHGCDGDSCNMEGCKQEAVCHVAAGLDALMTSCCK